MFIDFIFMLVSVPCILDSLEIIPNISLLAVPFLLKKDRVNQNTYANEEGDMISITAESVYHNLQEDSTLVSIKTDLAKVGGIYAIVHNETQKLYVGSSVNLARRVLEHLNNVSSKIILQHAISKHGLSIFSIYIL